MRGIAFTTLPLLVGCIPYSEPPPRPAAPRSDPVLDRRHVEPGITSLPAPPPAWEARRVTPDARTVAAQDYFVAAGDTLRPVSERTGASVEAIARANDLAPPHTLRSGQRLAIPAGRYHEVRAGESGIAIARAYGIGWGSIATANQLGESYVLQVGQRVLIPGSGAPSAAERAAACRLDIDDLLTGSQPAIAARERPVRPPTVARPLPSVAQVEQPRGSPGAFIWSAKGSIVRRFGAGRPDGRSNGIKIAVPGGTLAAADGVVAYVGSDIPSLGGLVIVTHGGGLTTVYGHANRLMVTRGQVVRRGQTLALSGSSGGADRPELHFEVRQGRTAVDPLARLPAL